MVEQQDDTKGRNKGEWSEPYVFLRLAGSGKLTAADEHLHPTDMSYPITQLFGNAEDLEGWKYILSDSLSPDYSEHGNVEIVHERTGQRFVITALEFTRNANLLLREIMRTRPSNQENPGRTFRVPEVQTFLDRVNYSQASKKKSDIRVVIHDAASGKQPQLGFSIKSYLGSRPTLFNASQSTRLRFRVLPTNLEEDLSELNRIPGPKGRVGVLLERASLLFRAPTNDTFERNLRVIDSRLPELLAEMVLMSFKGYGTSLSELTQLLADSDPVGIGQMQSAFYTYKVKAMLTDMALGMTATEPWAGIYTATGGFIIVDKQGDVLCYHIYNRNDFQDLLFRTTKIDTPDSRTKYATIESDENGLYVDLNFQIRFK